MRIFVVSSYGLWGNFNPSDLQDPASTKQIGGGETAMVSTARELAALGHEVMVFYNVGHFGRHDGVDYLPSEAFLSMASHMDHEVLVSWDEPMAFDVDSRARFKVLAFQMNDMIGPLRSRVDRFFHPSRWHAERFAELYPVIDRSRQRAVFTNGIDPSRYRQSVQRDPYRVMYSSSPDRGLHHLLRIWPRVQAAVPQASLHVYYEIEKWLRSMESHDGSGPIGARYVATYHAVKEGIQNVRARGDSVHFHGAIAQWPLAAEQLRARVLAYPCDPVAPTEGYSMTCLEAVTAGCRLIVSDADALGELWGEAPGARILPRRIDDELWAQEIVRALQSVADLENRGDFVEARSWKRLAKTWEREFTEGLRAP